MMPTCTFCLVESLRCRALDLHVELTLEREPMLTPLGGFVAARFSGQPEPVALFLDFPKECICR
jgi:hypothetical protein